MADRREFRRREFFNDILATRSDIASWPEWGNVDAEGADPLDQILYVRGVIVAAFGDIAGLRAESELEENPELRERLGRTLTDDEKNQLDQLLEEEGFLPSDEDSAPFENVRIYSGPPDADIPDILRRLPEEYAGRVAPEYAFLMQQTMHPVDDAEPIPFRLRIDAGRQYLGAGVTIAVLDTGLARISDLPEPLVGVRAAPGADDGLFGLAPGPSVPGTNYLGLCGGHGTFVSDLLKQVAPGTDVVNYRVAGPDGVATERTIVRQMTDARVNDQPRIMNMSFGMYALRVRQQVTVPPVLLGPAVHDAISHDVAIVASAGNSNSTDRMYPAAFNDVVGVAALDGEGRRCGFSNFGGWVRASARGLRMRVEYVCGTEDPLYETDNNADVFSGWAEWSGTSFAAPLVAASVAIVMTAAGLNPLAASLVLLAAANPAQDWGCGRSVRPYLPSIST